MQSTGQGGRHSSHPVQSAGSTVCMRLAAPTIASTGHAAMHSVQPMHQDSSIRAIEQRRVLTAARVEGHDGTPCQGGKRLDHRIAARRAAIDRFAFRNRLRIGKAALVAAAAALGLRQQRIDRGDDGGRRRIRHAAF